MWKSKRELIDSERIHKISIFRDDKQITYSEVIELWQHDNSFRTFFISLLADAPMSAYFWETPSVSQSTVDREFEFVLVNSPKLADLEPDPTDFDKHFESATESVVTFPNLGNDALLVVPCPIANTVARTHLASFVRFAPEFQQHLLWQTVGRSVSHAVLKDTASHIGLSLKQRLNEREQPIWVSTSGLGVHWLHVRLDSRPKYYCFEPYKNQD
ncbi:MAG TPA: hypothetical protein V6C71_05070 [Coleofasciculaceae cyanobacterium]|jgi:hypothetical protein